MATHRPLSPEEMRRRWDRRDPDANGRFLVGVVTTGVYCLPSCPARRPKPENVRFFPVPGEAEAAGLRPCKRCRPDLFYAGRDPDRERVEALLAEIRRAPGDFPDAASLAAAAGVGMTKLARLTRLHAHASPLALLQRARVEWASSELLGGDRKSLDIGLDAGYESASAFHEAFRRLTGMTPGAYRRLRQADAFTLLLPDDFRAADTLRFLGRDPESPTERVRGRTVVRALTLDGGPARLTVELGAGSARCRVERAAALAPAERAGAHRIAWRWLGLAGEARPERLTPTWNPLLRRRPGLRVPLTPTVFEGLTWAIVGQQVNLAFAYKLRRIAVELAGERLDPWLVAHPAPAALARLDAADLTRRQFSRGKAKALLAAAARATADLDLEALPAGTATVAEEALLTLPGVGPWSAQYVMLRACGFADCLPASDAGLTRALVTHFDLASRPGPDAARRLMAPFAPHRSLATFHLWSSLGDPA
jgi:AraC family transcriptional regulator of adaptative response / DNA-3-methyladenine glycosylase II